MILTCPDCASRYAVDDATIGPKGRTVRCVNCSATWRAMAVAPPIEAPLELTSNPSKTPATPQLTPKPDGVAATELPKKFRAERKARQRTHKAVAAGVIWGALAACLLAIAGGAALFRVDVVRLWPRTAGAYASVGLSVNPTGLSPENVKAQPGLKDGQAAVMVSGAIRNVETHPHALTPLRISLLDKAGKPLVSKIALFPPNETVAPGQVRPFGIAFLNPPAASHGVEVQFALDYAPPHAAEAHAPEGPAAPDAHAAPAAPEHGAKHPTTAPMPAAKNAQALPEDSPYALPHAAEGQGAAHAPAQAHAPTPSPAHAPAAAHSTSKGHGG